MKLVVVVTFLWTALAFGAEEKTPTPTMPSEVTLTTGRVLRKVEVVRWEKERVVLRYTGGVDPIAFSLIAEPHRSQIISYREELKKPESERRYARTIKGQIYVTTRGSGAYKFSDATIFAYPAKNHDALRSAAINSLPSDYSSRNRDSRSLHAAEAWHKVLERVKPIAISRTDADGKFAINLPNTEEVFLECLATRTIAGDYEVNFWAISPAGENVIMNDDNQWDPAVK